MEKERIKILSIHLTDLCNNKCIFCIVDSPAQKADRVSTERIYAFLEEHRDRGFAAVNLHGGESTTRKDFFDILAKIKACGYPGIILQTNGRKFSREDYTRRAVDLGITKFVVSVHGSKSEIHDHITQVPGSLKHAVKGIKNMKACGMHVRTNTVMSKLNYSDFPAVMDLLIRLNVDHVNISAIHTSGAAHRNFHQVVPRYTDVFPYLKESVAKITAAGITLTLEGFPFCMIPGMEQYIIDWEAQKFTMLLREHVMEDYESYMDDAMRRHGEPCSDCRQNKACGGVYREYITEFGWSEIGYGKISQGDSHETNNQE